jgi:hypothetical protein
MSKKSRKLPTSDDMCKSSAYKSRTDPPMYQVIIKLDGSEPEDVIEDEGVIYERTDRIPIDLDSIPDYIRESIGRATYEAVCEYLRQPGGRETLDALIAKDKASRKTQ